MGKIGSYEYPELKVEEAVRIAECLVNDFHKQVKDINEFASRLGHKSANSGTFLGKMGDVRRFGLMDKREYRATKRAEILANPIGNEKQKAIKEMVFEIPLFEKLNLRLRTKSPTVEQFRTQLIEITGDREKGSKEAAKIRKLYIDAISHIQKGIEQEDSFEENMESKQIATINEDIMVFKSGKTNLTLNKDDANIDILVSILRNLKTEKKEKQK